MRQDAARILVIDDDPVARELAEVTLEELGVGLRFAPSATEGLETLARHRDDIHVVLLDLGLPDMEGLTALEAVNGLAPDVPVIVLTASTDAETAVRCLHGGAADFVGKPFSQPRLIASTSSALQRARLQRDLAAGASRATPSDPAEAILGNSPAIQRAKDLITRAASARVDALISGESGTGKELAARAIHDGSERASGPFIAINCGAIPDGLIESELFGHAKGAFSGAASERIGAFEAADGGTLFLDEVGELPADAQVRLLRALQERCIRRIGETKERSLDVRIVAATHRDLESDVAEGRFREDLFYRLAVFPVELPALRERQGDTLLLAHHLLGIHARRHDRPARQLTPDAAAVLEAWNWPGNVRELSNVMERAILLEESETVRPAALPAKLTAHHDPDLQRRSDEATDAAERAKTVEVPAPSPTPPASHPEAPTGDDQDDEIRSFADEERAILERALRLTSGDVSEAARRLGIGRATLYRKIQRYELRTEP